MTLANQTFREEGENKIPGVTVADILAAAGGSDKQTDLLIIPGVAFDARGRDITGRSFLDIEYCGATVEVI